MNIDDTATYYEELNLSNALKIRKPVLPKIGVCYNCGEPVHINDTFCNVECREDYEVRNR